MDTFPTNSDRAEWARQTLERYTALTGNPPATQVVDLLADLLHLLDRSPDRDPEVPTAEVLAGYLDLALYHYRCELVESEAGDWATTGA